MDTGSYEEELRQGLRETIAKLGQIEGFVLYALNIWTDPSAGISEFSADTRESSDRLVREVTEWEQKERERLRAAGRDSLARHFERRLTRCDSPADFRYRGIVRIEHSNWQPIVGGRDGWGLVEDVLVRLRDEAAGLVGRALAVEPDAEVSIGTQRSWYDRAVPVIGAESATSE